MSKCNLHCTVQYYWNVLWTVLLLRVHLIPFFNVVVFLCNVLFYCSLFIVQHFVIVVLKRKVLYKYIYLTYLTIYRLWRQIFHITEISLFIYYIIWLVDWLIDLRSYFHCRPLQWTIISSYLLLPVDLGSFKIAIYPHYCLLLGFRLTAFDYCC